GAVVIDEDGITLDGEQGKFSAASLNWWADGDRVFSLGTDVDLGSVVGAYLEVDPGLALVITADDTAFSGNVSVNDDLDVFGNLRVDLDPVAVRSGTLQTDLNADLLDGNHASAFALASHNHNSAYSQHFTGAGAPSSGLGKPGDTYTEDSGDVYIKD